MPTWVDVCVGAGELLSTKAFQPPVDPIVLKTTTATGRRKSVVVGGNKRPRTGKRSLETVRNGAWGRRVLCTYTHARPLI